MHVLELNIVNVLNGSLSVGPRPRKKMLRQYGDQGISHIWTLLSEKEGALDIKQSAMTAGLEWIWLPLANGKVPEKEKLTDITDCFDSCKTILNSGANVYLHCSAGIHRTGMISYGFLRYCGYSRSDSLDKVKAMRLITSEGVGEERLSWGDATFG